MNPSAYLDLVRHPILALFAYSWEIKLMQGADLGAARDLRQFLNGVLAEQQQRINDHPDQTIRSQYRQERRSLTFLHEVLNTHAHEHGRAMRNLAMSASAEFEFSIHSTNVNGTPALVRHFWQINDECFSTSFSEFATPPDQNEDKADPERKFDAVHDKRDAMRG